MGVEIPHTTENTIDITPMGHPHLDELYEIELLSFPVPWSKRLFRKELDNPLSLSYVAQIPDPPLTDIVDAGMVIGYAVNWLSHDEFHILNLAVHPHYRRKGIGKILLKYSLSRAGERGAEKAFLEVRRSNSSAIELYKKLGFHTVGVRQRYYSNNHEDAFIMRMDFPSLPQEWDTAPAIRP